MYNNSPLCRKPFGGINANQLRGLAMFLMLLDHLWATLVPGNFWMTYLGRLASVSSTPLTLPTPLRV